MAQSEAVNMLVSGATLTIGRTEAAQILVEVTCYANDYVPSQEMADMMRRLVRSFDAERAMISVNYTRESFELGFLERGYDASVAALKATNLFGNLVTALGNAKVR